jgi:hypothetical protein
MFVVSRQTNHDIIYIFQIVENFLNLFGNLHESFTCVILERDHLFSFKLTWAPQVQSSCINPLLKHLGFHANRIRLRYSPRAHMGKMFRYDE